LINSYYSNQIKSFDTLGRTRITKSGFDLILLILEKIDEKTWDPCGDRCVHYRCWSKPTIGNLGMVSSVIVIRAERGCCQLVTPKGGNDIQRQSTSWVSRVQTASRRPGICVGDRKGAATKMSTESFRSKSTLVIYTFGYSIGQSLDVLTLRLPARLKVRLPPSVKTCQNTTLWLGNWVEKSGLN
jgi:hypothetical protein